ncbi:MAG: DNA mismatch repair endonuclease MutL [Oscillospiraceae bacterium]|nr:DNA mismatch repair endonuclease MutL [Oscillospiraceae bacterium]
MSVINILSPHVADLIAAGEVVERPASVVKELVENAIDAGARSVRVEIRRGGMESIRVTDDGCGMSPEDAGIAFQRHATSKLRDAAGLEAISTLGFRGEALAAIAAVSHVELRTRERGAAEGTGLSLSAGDIQEMHPVGTPEGTVMLVRELFYNTPARRKFLKSDRAEAAACVGAALRCALGHPEVSLRMLRDGEEVFFSPGDGREQSAVYALLGRDISMGLIPCQGEAGGLRVHGYVSAPHAGRGSRAVQYFFLNGRAFRSLTVQTALEQAYRNSLLSGRFPAAVLWLELAPGKVDVNVHPSKSEVKFSDERSVFEAVWSAVRGALEAPGERGTAEVRLSPGTAKRVRGGADDPPAARPAPERPPIQSVLPLQSALPPYELSPSVPRPELFRKAEGNAAPVQAPSQRFSQTSTGSPVSASSQTSAHTLMESKPPAPPFRLIGEALGTYILVETEGSLLLIDKHAAHERLNFDRLLAGLGPQMRQTLLTPLRWTCGGDTAELLERSRALLEEAGFELERFGEDGVVLLAVPGELAGDPLETLEELAEQLRRGRPEDARERILRTVACKAAIKSGDRSDRAELEALAARVLRGEVRTCPHGRPVSLRLTRAELDRQFLRTGGGK